MLRALSGGEINHPGLCNEVAWWLVTAPDLKDREPDRAVALARKATDQAPKIAAGWNTLGVALYRAGASDEAIKALSQSVDLTSGGSPADWFFLAMARWQKGEKDEARRWYERAVAEMDRMNPNDDELKRFRAETAALLGITATFPQERTSEGRVASPGASTLNELPADVFAPVPPSPGVPGTRHED